MTYEEHVARALLLGCDYDWRDGTYCPIGVTGEWDIDNMLDCLTLEPISHRNAVFRQVVPLSNFEPSERHKFTGLVPWETS